MTARDALLDRFEVGEDLAALARRLRATLPAAALALARAFQARADAYALGADR